jgi:hypothetical protein
MYPNESTTSHELSYLVGYYYGALGVNKIDQEWVIIDSLGGLTYVPDPQVSSITGSSCLSSGQSVMWSPTHLYLIDYSNSISVEENTNGGIDNKPQLHFVTGGKINVITNEDWTLRVLSLDGKLVFEESGSGSTTEIQLPQLPYQPYLISLETENSVRHYKYLFR